jgi:hypothetical protein
MKTIDKRAIVLILALLCASCVTTKTLSYSDHTIYQGTGGACETRDGIDLWWNGTPPRKYTIIGVLIQGTLSPAGDAALVREAKAMGGNGVLRGSRDSYRSGSYSRGFGTVSGYGNFATVSGSRVAHGQLRPLRSPDAPEDE